ncbi:unnamed protein product [Diatraea saccharalis]|uniref:Uncharacterized protein n=1 Tax=Diatraea saccharalis TaxID=40085 RepID=A0A9N9WLL7_9NEOP|nr:unnamed protein product [Diatraea saccharalis]
MSEEIDLNTNNLCTTEDAFEKFQAISMYEEDEFITLSDLVSPRQEVSDQGDLNDIRYENEVILDSQLEEQVPEVNSTIELGPDENKVVEECSSLPKEYTTECSSSIERAQETRPKKGRRKKTQQNDSILTVNHTHNEQQEILTLDDKQYQSTPPPSTPQRRRGRKPKQNKQVIDNVSITGTTLNDTEKVDNSMQIIPANIDDIESQNTSTENENFSGSPYPKRRGRPKKKHQVKNIDLPKEENNTLKTEEGVSEIIEAKDFMTSDESNLTQKVTKKGKRKQQLSVEKDFHEEIDTMDTEPTFSGQSLELEKCSNTVPIKPIKGPKKPRKSKKHQNKNTLIKDPTETDFKKTLSEEDFGDDISLSKLKETLEPPNGVSLETQNTEEMLNDSTNVPCSVTEKTELMEIEIKEIKTINSDLPTVVEPDLNTTIDIKENKQEISVNDIENKEDINDSLLIEDISKRPMRRRARKTFHYDEDSDEDPFANVELSEDDEPKRGKKSGKYYSDDEYIPGGKKHGSISSSDASDSDIDAVVNEFNSKLKRKRQRLDVSTDKSPKKYGKKTKCEKDKSLEVKTITPDTSLILEDDIEVCLQSSLIKANEDSKQKLGWGASNEFENFIAKRIQGTDIKIKKASSVQPLEIPVIDPNDAKKTKETSTQTARVHTTSAEVQTSVPYDIPMKDNVPLTIEQTEKACEFLKGIVKTTAELGQLMTQKSEDFISKKINTSHVTDTFKMDYCVRKSFLLFKLAKHNLMQMEEDLSKRYDEFLKDNDLVKHREKPKELLSTKKSDDGDSDCEIIDAPPIVLQKPKKENTKPKFNPKTVFLNKELSIKIAKKPSEEKKLEIKGRHTVWISDSVMVKKVKPTQSFLAKGSRKKKPPDYITIEMVNNFFKEYNRKQALLACAPFVTTEWLYSFNENVVCSYFVTKCDEYSSGSVSEIPSDSELDSNNETIIINPKNMSIQHSNNELKTYNVSTLFSLCTQVLQRQLNLTTSKPYDKSVNKQGLNNRQVLHSLNYMCLKNIKLHITPNLSLEDLEKRENRNALPLLTLCFNKITEAMDNHYHELHKDSNPKSQCYNLDLQLSKDELHPVNNFPPQNVKSLFTLCVTFMQKQLQFKNVDDYQRHLSKKVEIEPNTLKHITFKIIANLINTDNVNIINNMGKVKTLSNLCFQIVKKCLSGYEERTTKECLTINSINRLTEEAYFNIEEGREGLTENDDYYADEDTNFYEDETEDNDFSNFDEISNTEVNSWISQVEVKEFRSIPNKLTETVRSTEEQRTSPITEDATVITARIKIEPEEEPENIDPSIIKTEPLHNLDEMTIIPESIMTNSISTGNDFTNDQVQGKNSASYDVDSFETFVKSNKLMNALSEHDDFPEIFSQSASRIRRQFEPDWDTENDMAMSLLVPQTFEPMHIENAKDRLMESSGDENNSTKKPAGKKKLDKRKGKLKKVDQKPDKQLSTEKVVAKENPKEKQPAPNEIAVLTRRMREKIRQEEKKIASSDSETENGITSKKFKEINNILSKKTKETLKEASKTKQKNSKTKDDEIQCNNVDSTQQINDQKKCYSPDPNSVQFTGFSAVDQNEGFNYQKYMKYVYDKILPTVSGESKSETNKPIINPDEPVELLECEPTMPIFDNEDTMITSNIVPHEEILVEKTAAAIKRDDRSLPYKLRHGWKCYQLQSNDTKLYEDAQIVLEKLPESFVETYFTYQNISYRDKEDDEVDRLINLQTLNRSKDIRDKGKPKSRLLLQDQISEDNHNDSKAISPVNFDEVVPSDDEGNHAKKKNENISAKREGKSKTKLLSQELTCSRTVSEGNFNDSRAASPTYSDYHELTPSEDENANVEDKVCSPNNNSENTLAKSSLMDDDKDSDNDTKVKIEPDEDVMQRKIKKKPKIGPKSKVKKTEPIDSESFMLTADKMMNRELNLLHAPILPVEEAQKTPLKCPVTRSKQRSANKSATDHKRVKEEDGGSSSEEEKKQWFTIKEKLLKKMINKKDTTRVLSRELFGDVSNDSTHQGKGRNTAYFKGRRNIRKVLDKKCLAKSTVLANMEEFERKRRLNMRQSKLRELLGCEEGVNVLVINDEVCLEYDFEMQRPIVTIHPFFTKVMKAHQYEGVKFMWDACFESLEDIKSGHPGGGCILAHCMGLGKTLQVLALLHTQEQPGAWEIVRYPLLALEATNLLRSSELFPPSMIEGIDFKRVHAPQDSRIEPSTD